MQSTDRVDTAAQGDTAEHDPYILEDTRSPHKSTCRRLRAKNGADGSRMRIQATGAGTRGSAPRMSTLSPHAIGAAALTLIGAVPRLFRSFLRDFDSCRIRAGVRALFDHRGRLSGRPVLSYVRILLVPGAQVAVNQTASVARLMHLVARPFL
jgi:hypothetical protein